MRTLTWRRGAGFVLLACLVAAGAAWPARRADKPDAPALPQPVVTTHELMELFNKPIHDTLRGALEFRVPDEKQWKKVLAEARRAGEVANLIAIRKDAAKHKGWKQMADDVQKAAGRLAHAADKKDYDAARKAYVGLIERCNACHQAASPDHAPTLAPFKQ